VGDYFLTAESLVTGSLADDDIAMGGYHIGINRPSGSGWRRDCGRPATAGSCMAVDTRGFGGRRRDTDLPPGQYRTDDFSLDLLGRRNRSPVGKPRTLREGWSYFVALNARSSPNHFAGSCASVWHPTLMSRAV
jgi:hypothetical protein